MLVKRLALGLALALALIGSALAQPFEITVDHELDSPYEVTFAILSQQNEDLMGGGASWPYSFSGTGSFANPFEQGVSTGIATLIGLYSGGSGNDPGVAVLMNNGYAPEFVGMPWDSVFSSHTEQEIIDALLAVQAGAPGFESSLDVIGNFFNANLDKWTSSGQAGSFVGYSSHTILGSGKWQQQPVPEPGLLIAAGAAGAFLIRRRRTR